jgi:hypothetical protein
MATRDGYMADVRTPADPEDQQTTDAKSALPPVEFTLSPAPSANLLTIHDRQGVQNRIPTVSYRIYFLPEEFAPIPAGTTATVSGPVVMVTKARAAGRKVADLVADVKAPGLGTFLKVEDKINVGKKGYYFCVGVNRASVEAPVEHMVSTENVVVTS